MTDLPIHLTLTAPMIGREGVVAAFASGARDGAAIYQLMTGVIVPRPIAFVATLSPGGAANLAPFSFFNMITATPPTIAVSVGSRGGRPKDTAANIRAVGEFVVHVVSEPLLPAMNIASAEFPPEVDEIAAAGLTRLAGVGVSVPRIAEAPVAMECRLLHVLTFGSPARRTYHIIGEVVYFHVDDRLFDDEGVLSPARLAAIGRMGRGAYVRTRERLLMPAPMLATDGRSATTAEPHAIPTEGA